MCGPEEPPEWPCRQWRHHCTFLLCKNNSGSVKDYEFVFSKFFFLFFFSDSEEKVFMFGTQSETSPWFGLAVHFSHWNQRRIKKKINVGPHNEKKTIVWNSSMAKPSTTPLLWLCSLFRLSVLHRPPHQPAQCVGLGLHPESRQPGTKWWI